MEQLTGKSEQEIFADLQGVIFLNPMHTSENDGHAKYLTADEYLSGNVREKLDWARRSAELYPQDYAANVQALEAVQPVDLTASEISVRLGATWLPTGDVEDFMFELFSTPRYSRWNIHVHFSEYTCLCLLYTSSLLILRVLSRAGVSSYTPSACSLHPRNSSPFPGQYPDRRC